MDSTGLWSLTVLFMRAVMNLLMALTVGAIIATVSAAAMLVGLTLREILKTHEPKSRRIPLSHSSKIYLTDIQRQRSMGIETSQKKLAHHTMQRQNTQG